MISRRQMLAELEACQAEVLRLNQALADCQAGQPSQPLPMPPGVFVTSDMDVATVIAAATAGESFLIGPGVRVRVWAE